MTDRSLPAPTLRLAGAPWAAGATLAAGTAVSLLAAGSGASQVRGAVLGTALVCGFFLLGALNTGLAAAYAPRLSMLVALLTYAMQVVALGLVFAWLHRSGLADGRVDRGWLAATVIAGTLTWTAVLVVRALRDPEVQR